MQSELVNLFELFIVETCGAALYEEAIDLARRDTLPATARGQEATRDLFDLLNEASAQLGLTPDDACFEFGFFCYPYLTAKLAELISIPRRPKELLRAVHELTKIELRGASAGAPEAPEIRYADPSPETFVVSYRSAPKLFPFFEGLVHGISAGFDMPITIDRTISPDGSACELHLAFGH